jgi:hypothetical protein
MVTVDESFINPKNLLEAIAQLPDPDYPKKCRLVADVQALIHAETEANFRWVKVRGRSLEKADPSGSLTWLARSMFFCWRTQQNDMKPRCLPQRLRRCLGALQTILTTHLKIALVVLLARESRVGARLISPRMLSPQELA